jgi:VWFA-related protein
MRNKLNIYLTMSVFCGGVLLLCLNNFCLAQSLRSENVEIKNFRSNLKNTEADKTEEDDVIRVETNLIISDILVFDKNGNSISDLKIDDFIVKENDKPQEISTFSFGDSEIIPRSIVLIIDYSGSQLPYIKTSIEAAKFLVDKLNPRDRMAIVTDDVELLQDFTTDKTALKEKLEFLKTKALSGKMGQSKQYSALMKVLRQMFTEKGFRPIVIFQTDGDELLELKGERLNRLNSKEARLEFGFDDILTATEKTRVTVYSIIPGVRFFGIPENEQLERSKTATINGEKAFYGLRNKIYQSDKLKLTEGFLKSQAYFYNRQQSALNQVAQISGGLISYLEQPEQADKVYSGIFSEMNQRYLIGYYPTNQSRNGKNRNVSIELRAHPEYKIWGRKNYILDEK